MATTNLLATDITISFGTTAFGATLTDASSVLDGISNSISEIKPVGAPGYTSKVKTGKSDNPKMSLEFVLNPDPTSQVTLDTTIPKLADIAGAVTPAEETITLTWVGSGTTVDASISFSGVATNWSAPIAD